MWNLNDRVNLTVAGRRALAELRKRRDEPEADPAPEPDACCACDATDCACPPRHGVNPASNLYDIADAVQRYMEGGRDQ